MWLVAMPAIIPPPAGFLVGVTIGTCTAWATLAAATESVTLIPRLARLAAIGYMRASDASLRWWHGASATCPGCHWVARLPAYHCSGDNCDAIHRDLRPGRLGLLWHRCRCGARLPTTVQRASRTLTPVCPACGHWLHERAGFASDARIALSGGPSVGKTQLLIWAATAMAGDAYSPSAWEPADDHSIRWLRASRELINRWPQHRPARTAEPALVTFSCGTSRDRRYVHFADVGGQHFSTDANHPAMRQFGTTRRHLFVLDSATIPSVRDRIDPARLVSDPLDARNPRPAGPGTSNAMVELPYHLLVTQLKRFGARTRRCSLAIVVMKADLLTVYGLRPVADPEETSSLRLRSWLRAMDLTDLVETAENDFREVKYFLADYGTDRTDPVAPFAWLLAKHPRGASIP